MEDDELLTKSDLQQLNPLPDTNPAKTGYDAYREWAGERLNNYGIAPPDPSQYAVPRPSPSGGTITSGTRAGKANTISDDIDAVNSSANQNDSTKFAIKTAEISNRYPVTFKGVDNESVYAQGQT